MIKSVTKKFITEIIQESTDAIYRFEDDSISLADSILRDVLEREIRNVVNDVTQVNDIDRSIQNQDISMDFAEMDDLGDFGEFGDPTDLNDVPNEHHYPF